MVSIYFFNTESLNERAPHFNFTVFKYIVGQMFDFNI